MLTYCAYSDTPERKEQFKVLLSTVPHNKSSATMQEADAVLYSTCRHGTYDVVNGRDAHRA